MDRATFFLTIERLAPGTDIGEATALASLPVAQRTLVTRWLASLFEQPADHDIVRQLATVGDAWGWVSGALRTGDVVRRPAPGAGERWRVALRPLVDQDLPAIYLAALDPARSSAWRYRGRTVPADEFIATLADGVRAQYAVELRATGDLVGLVVAYDHHQAGRHCKVGFLRTAPDLPGAAGATTEAMFLFLDHLFATHPYRKVYAEVPAYNLRLFHPGFGSEEAVLRDYLFHDGAPVDLHILSVTRAQWEAISPLARL